MNNDINEKIVHAAPVPPFVRFVASAVPMVFDNSLSYYEALCALWKWMQDNLVDVINNNATVTEHYIDLDLETRSLFNQLKTYVDTYFDNLDVQDEINNKLDEMAESGTLQEIITAYIQANVAWTFDTVADMKAATNLVNGSYAQTLGFHSVNDGGGALYHITNTGTANEMDVIAIGSLFANLINGDNVKQYGAYGDNEHDDSAYIQRAISANYHGSIHFPVGEYVITTPINITSSINITGEGIHSVLVKKDTSSYNVSINYNNVPFNFNDYPSIFNAVFPADSNLTYLKINGLQFTENVTGQTKATYAIVAPHLGYSTIQNCRYTNFNSCLLLGGWCNTVKKCEYFNSTLALTVDSNFNFINNKISENYFNHSGISIKNAHNCSLNNCQADSVSVAYVFIDCNSISMINCSTEAWAESVRADNSFVTLQNCDLELHDKDNYTAFITATNASQVNVSDSYIHYEDYSTPGEYPSSTNIVSNAGGSTIKIKNCKISIPFTYKDYISGNGVNIINDYTNSNSLSIPSKLTNKITSGNKVEIARLPFAYGSRLQVKVSGYGTFDYTSVLLDANIVAINRGSNDKPIVVDDNTMTANSSSLTYSITAEYDDGNLVVYYNQSNAWSFPVEVFVEYNKATA